MSEWSAERCRVLSSPSSRRQQGRSSGPSFLSAVWDASRGCEEAEAKREAASLAGAKWVAKLLREEGGGREEGEGEGEGGGGGGGGVEDEKRRDKPKRRDQDKPTDKRKDSHSTEINEAQDADKSSALFDIFVGREYGRFIEYFCVLSSLSRTNCNLGKRFRQACAMQVRGTASRRLERRRCKRERERGEERVVADYRPGNGSACRVIEPTEETEGTFHSKGKKDGLLSSCLSHLANWKLLTSTRDWPPTLPLSSIFGYGWCVDRVTSHGTASHFVTPHRTARHPTFAFAFQCTAHSPH